MIRRIALIPAFLIIFGFSNAASQYWVGGVVSNDSLYAGEVDTLLVFTGHHDIDTVEARLVLPQTCFGYYYCLECIRDTILPDEIRSYNDTLVELIFDFAGTTHPSTRWKLEINNASYYSKMKMFTPPVIYNAPVDSTVYNGGRAEFRVCYYATEPLKEIKWFHDGNPLHWSAGKTTLKLEEIEYTDSGAYYCRVRNVIKGKTITSWSDTAYLTVLSAEEFLATPDGPDGIMCYTPDSMIYRIPRHDTIKFFKWVLDPHWAGTTYAINDTVDTLSNIAAVVWNDYFHGDASIRVLGTRKDNISMASDRTKVFIQGIPGKENLCHIGWDEETDFFKIIWEGSDNPIAVSYNILRDIYRTGDYIKLDSLPMDSPGIFVDSVCTPAAFPHTYMLSVTDTCGNDSKPGKRLTAVYLESTIGTDGEYFLSWTHYGGNSYSEYELYHGYEKDSMTLLMTFPSEVTSHSIIPPPGGPYYYQIRTINADSCNPVNTTDTVDCSTRSNYIGVNATFLPDRAAMKLMIYPNPATDHLRISYTEMAIEKPELRILNLSGIECGRFTLRNKQAEIDVSHLEPGIYLLHLYSDRESVLRKFVKQ